MIVAYFVAMAIVFLGGLFLLLAGGRELVLSWRAARQALRDAVELPEVDAAVRRHPAGKARTAQPRADRGQFWATLGTPDVLATDRERQERAQYELVKQKLKGVR